ncbi:helix-turn-helix domain-containing protein [Neorhizobium sp. NPDC001467]|uniref:helix-turn-helix domain-containing protein n=1 Tax=Neorhizobium sp. NPDC001467 TaxID=3390595 RepID=UPI003CFDB25D
MITPSQLRAGRAMAGLTIDDLAASTGLSPEDIDAAENSETLADALMASRLQSALESRGIVFLATGQDDASVGPGLRLRTGSIDEGLRPERLNATNDD